LTIGSRFRIYNDFRFVALDIVGVIAQNNGQYVCRETNQLGQQVVEQEFKQPPQFVKPLKNVDAVEVQNAHLEASLLPTGDSTMNVE